MLFSKHRLRCASVALASSLGLLAGVHAQPQNSERPARQERPFAKEAPEKTHALKTAPKDKMGSTEKAPGKSAPKPEQTTAQAGSICQVDDDLCPDRQGRRALGGMAK
ncbi:MAG: hypothetical protein V4614_12990 [Pseudomonadota bacterium]